MNTRVPWGTPLPPREAVEGDDEVLKTKKPYISNLIFGTVARRPVYTITVPVLEGGEVTFFLHLSLELQRLVGLLNENISPGRIAGIFDRNHVFMARSEKFEEYVGRLPKQSFIDNVTGSEGHWRGINYEGEMVRVGYARSKLAGWWIWVSIPEQAVQSSLRETLRALAALGAALTLLAIFIAYLFGGRLSGAISTLALQAEALGRGKSISVQRIASQRNQRRGWRNLLRQASGARRWNDSLCKKLPTKASNSFRCSCKGSPITPSICLIRRGRFELERRRATDEGYTAEEIVGQHFSRFYTEEDRKRDAPMRGSLERRKRKASLRPRVGGCERTAPASGPAL